MASEEISFVWTCVEVTSGLACLVVAAADAAILQGSRFHLLVFFAIATLVVSTLRIAAVVSARLEVSEFE